MTSKGSEKISALSLSRSPKPPSTQDVTPRPDEWKKSFDPKSGRPFYYNSRTRKTSWTNPNLDATTSSKGPASLASPETKFTEKALARAQSVHKYALKDRLAIYDFAQRLLLPGEEFLLQGERGIFLCSKIFIEKSLGAFHSDLSDIEGGGYSLYENSGFKKQYKAARRGCCHTVCVKLESFCIWFWTLIMWCLLTPVLLCMEGVILCLNKICCGCCEFADVAQMLPIRSYIKKGPNVPGMTRRGPKSRSIKNFALQMESIYVLFTNQRVLLLDCTFVEKYNTTTISKDPDPKTRMRFGNEKEIDVKGVGMVSLTKR